MFVLWLVRTVQRLFKARMPYLWPDKSERNRQDSFLIGEIVSCPVKRALKSGLSGPILFTVGGTVAIKTPDCAKPPKQSPHPAKTPASALSLLEVEVGLRADENLACRRCSSGACHSKMSDLVRDSLHHLFRVPCRLRPFQMARARTDSAAAGAARKKSSLIRIGPAPRCASCRTPPEAWLL
ncbi:hypothetical protein MRX96_007552 [Rhipicephalus microplus]